MRKENIVLVIQHIRENPQITYSEVVDYLVSLGRDEVIAQKLLDIFIQVCYEYYIISENTFESLKDKVLSLEESDADIVSKIEKVVALYSADNPLIGRFLALLEEVDSLKEEIANSEEVSEEELLEWAKENHPTYKEFIEKQQLLEQRMDDLNTLMEQI